MKKLLSAPALFAGAGILLIVGLLLAFWYSPTDSSSMGFSQKIFYYHAPIAETALVAFGVAFVAAIAYLRTQDLKWDRLGYVSVRLGLLFSILVMITGMIWGKAAWGTWWAWEPRLTTFLLVCFLYVAYLVLRSVVDEEQRRATYAAVFAIIAFIDVPITFFATRFLPEGLHPVVIGPGRRGHGRQHGGQLRAQHARHDAAARGDDPPRLRDRTAQGPRDRPQDLAGRLTP